jgi:hypothetical protein
VGRFGNLLSTAFAVEDRGTFQLLESRGPTAGKIKMEYRYPSAETPLGAGIGSSLQAS